MTPIYFARRGAEDLVASQLPGAVQSKSIRYQARNRRLPKPEAMHTTVNQISQGRASQQDVQGPRAGSPFGSLVEGSALGEEIKPALPIYGPQPEVASYELPTGLQGDVVVEITIDAQGTVVQTSLLRGLGHGLDEKVLAVLQNWRFHPATRDGVPIPSRQDVYFHFPHA
jgi:protein TonB